MKQIFQISFLLVSMLLPNLAMSQKTQIYTDPHELYEQGVDLFSKHQYGPSIRVFEKYLKVKDAEPLLLQKAELYILMNEVKLERKNAHRDLMEYLREQPQNNTTNLATFTLADYYFKKEKYRSAARWFDKVDVSNLPKDMWDEANFKMAYSFFKDDEYDKAKPVFDKIRTQDGQYFIESNYYYGYICYIQKEYDKALRAFEKIRGKGPQIMELYIGQIYYGQKAYKMALEQAKEHKEGKYNKEYTLLIAKSYFQLEEYNKALESFKEYGLNTDDLLVDEIWQMAYSYYHAGDYETAHPIYVKISNEDNALGQLVNYQLGECFLKLDMKQNAFYAFGVAKEMSFNAEIKEIAHFNYAKLAFELGQNQVAMNTTQDFIESYPKSEFRDPAQGMLAEMFLNLKNYTQAVKVLEQIQTFNPQTKSVYQRITYIRGEQLYMDRNNDLSSTFFEKSLRFTPDALLAAQSHFWLGEINYNKKKYASAIKQYNLFLNGGQAKNSKYYHDAYYAMGYSYYMMKNYPLALNYFKQYNAKATLVENRRKYADNALRLGDVYYRLNKIDEAISSYGYVGSRNLPGADYALFQQAHLYGINDEYTQKIVTLQRIESAYSKSPYYERALFSIATTYFENLHETDRAINYYNKLVNTGIRSELIADTYFRLALIYYSKTMNEKAVDYCEKAIKEYPRTQASNSAMKLRTQILKNQGRTEDILALEGIAMTTKDSLVYATALEQYRKGELQKASKAFSDYLDNFPEGFFVLQANYYKGQSLIKQDKDEEALPYLRFVANQKKNEYSDYSLSELAKYHFNKKNYDLALPYYARLDSITDDREAYVNALMGQIRCHYQLKNYDAGKEIGKRILATEKISKFYVLETNLLMGKMALEQGNYLTAQYHFGYVSKESKGEMGAEALYLSAVSSFKQDELDETEEKIFQLDDEFTAYEYWVVKGYILFSDVYLAKGDYFQARATLNTILDNYKDGERAIIEECEAKLKHIDELEKGESQEMNNEGTEDGNSGDSESED